MNLFWGFNMFNKKAMVILLLLIVSICAISAVSASDEAADIVASDDAVTEDLDTNIDDDLSTSVEEADDSEELAVSEEIDDGKELASSDEVSEVSTVESNENEELSAPSENEALSAYSPNSTYYSATVYDAQISASQAGNVSIYVNPCTYTYYNAYDFYVRVYKTRTEDSTSYYFSDKIYEKRVYSEDRSNYWTYTFPAGTFTSGTYYIALVNYYDGVFLSHAVLTVTGSSSTSTSTNTNTNTANQVKYAVITANNYAGYYLAGKKMSVRVTNKKTGAGLSNVKLKVVFTKKKKTVTKYYTTNSNGYANFVPPVGVGTYTVSISPVSSNIKATKVTKTATVKKSKVKIKAFKITEYKGFKVKIKAKVTSHGKKVNEGKVTFKINGKTYKVKVKNGIATKTLKLKKVKKYKYTAKFTGANFYKSKKAKGKVTIKKRLATKIIINSRQVYSNAQKVITIKVLTKSGKKVKNGKLKGTFVNGVGYYNVKNGKVRVGIQGLGNEHLRWFNGVTSSYKKYIKKSAKFTYIPSSHKYKSSTKKVKLVSKFRCNCGRTTSHNHYGHSYGYAYGNVNTYVTDRVIIS